MKSILKYLTHDFASLNCNCHTQTHYGDVPMNLIVLCSSKGSLSSFNATRRYNRVNIKGFFLLLGLFILCTLFFISIIDEVI